MAIERKEIEQVLYEVVGKVFSRDVSTITPELKWKEDLNVKSVHGMKVCATLNYKFGIKLPVSKLIDCETIGDAVSMLDEFINN